MGFGKTSHLYDNKISEHVSLESVKRVKILRVQVDNRLIFSGHIAIAGLFKKAGKH